LLCSDIAVAFVLHSVVMLSASEAPLHYANLRIRQRFGPANDECSMHRRRG
jgi:hypothetical protein